MFSLKIQNFKPRKLAKNLAVNVEKRIQFSGRCTMKVSEREISRQMKVRKTAVPNTIKKISKKVLSRTAKKQAVRAFLVVEIKLLILKLPCAILACIFFSGALRKLTHSLPNKTFISTTKNARTACFLLSLKVLFL